ncbi:MAG: 3-dehydroquinate synthase, partial [Planctomycetota bacterium]
MTNTTLSNSLLSFISSLRAPAAPTDITTTNGTDHDRLGTKQKSLVDSVIDSAATLQFIEGIAHRDVMGDDVGAAFDEEGWLDALAPYRQLRSTLGLSFGSFLHQVALLAETVTPSLAHRWRHLADEVLESDLARKKTLAVLELGAFGMEYRKLADELETEQPHAVYPTSPFRESAGHVVSTDDSQRVEAVMNLKTFTSIRVTEGVLGVENPILRDIYKPLGRCVALVDENVEEHFGDELEDYFAQHGIPLKKLVYRAMEVDKGIATVEKMLGDFKKLGVSRNEAVLIAGGGVLADTGGLACALYHRATPYVMLSTSLVAGIDAGPSPRTCCDGFGYKNLFGSYHTPILSITDRTFFCTLHEGWLRHGVAEIIKMASVKDVGLFEMLEEGGERLVTTRFGSLDTEPGDPIHDLSNRILGRAMRSYVEAEYGNLYETHQCRPHAFGHTWSPGFEIQAGLLHGHAISVGMGFGAFVARRTDWINDEQCARIMRLISSFGL